jgi:hypothetical protein
MDKQGGSITRLLDILKKSGMEKSISKSQRTSATSSEDEHGSSFEKMAEQAKGKSLFQLALAVEDFA